jgi:hypothetical protein
MTAENFERARRACKETKRYEAARRRRLADVELARERCSIGEAAARYHSAKADLVICISLGVNEGKVRELLDRLDDSVCGVVLATLAPKATVELARARNEITGLKQELENERHDLGVICGEVSQVYDELTFGRLSKPNTAAEHIIAAAKERVARMIEDAEEPLKEVLGEILSDEEVGWTEPLNEPDDYPIPVHIQLCLIRTGRKMLGKPKPGSNPAVLGLGLEHSGRQKINADGGFDERALGWPYEEGHEGKPTLGSDPAVFGLEHGGRPGD